MPLNVNGIRIEDTFAEAFDMRATALIITADYGGMGTAGGRESVRVRDLYHRLRHGGRHRPPA